LFDHSTVGIKHYAIGFPLISLELFWIPVMVGILYVADLFFNGGIIKNIRKLIFDGVIGVFFVIASYTSTNFHLLAVGVFLICSDKASMRNISKVIAASLLAGTVVIAVLSQVGLAEDIMVYRFNRVAHSLGFPHYAFPARQLLFAWCAYLYAKTKKESWPMLILQLGLIYLIYYFTTQRLTVIVFVAVWIMYIVFVKYELINISSLFIKLCSLIGFAVAGAGSLIITYLYDPAVMWMEKLDTLLNGRLNVGNLAFDRYKIALFGPNPIIAPENAEGYFYMDCGYLEVIINYGLIIFIITTVLYTIIHLYSCCKKDNMLFVWLTAIMVYTVVDCVWLDMTGAATALILFGAILSEIKKENSKLFLRKQK